MRSKDSLREVISSNFSKRKNYLEMEKKLDTRKNFKYEYFLLLLVILLGGVWKFKGVISFKNSDNIKEIIIINQVDDDFLRVDDDDDSIKKGNNEVLPMFNFIDEKCLENGYTLKDFKEVNTKEIKYQLDYLKDKFKMTIYILKDDYSLKDYQSSIVASRDVYILEDDEYIYFYFEQDNIKILLKMVKEEKEEGINIIKSFN